MIARLWDWFLSSNPATTITALAAVIAAFRVQSNHEHRKTMSEIKKVGVAVNGGLLARLDRIEAKLGIAEADQ